MLSFLVVQKITELKAQHRRERDRRVADRIKAGTHKNDGRTNNEIVQSHSHRAVVEVYERKVGTRGLLMIKNLMCYFMLYGFLCNYVVDS